MEWHDISVEFAARSLPSTFAAKAEVLGCCQLEQGWATSKSHQRREFMSIKPCRDEARVTDDPRRDFCPLSTAGHMFTYFSWVKIKNFSVSKRTAQSQLFQNRLYVCHLYRGIPFFRVLFQTKFRLSIDVGFVSNCVFDSIYGGQSHDVFEGGLTSRR